jgi:hypothetical protein
MKLSGLEKYLEKEERQIWRRFRVACSSSESLRKYCVRGAWVWEARRLS